MDELVTQALRELPRGREVQQLMTYEGLQNINELAKHIGVNVDVLLKELKEGHDLSSHPPGPQVLAPR